MKKKRPHRETPAAVKSAPVKVSMGRNSQQASLTWFLTDVRLQSVLVVTVAFLLYANTLGHQWAQDDRSVITENMLTQQGLAGIPKIFTTDAFFGYYKTGEKADIVAGGRYRPLTVAMFAVVVGMFGTKPFPFHLFTVSLYALSCLLLYHTVLRLLRRSNESGYAEISAFMVTILFAVHPVHTEVVANVKGCDEIVALLGSLGALLLSVVAFESGKIGYGIAASAALFLGLLAKENAVTFVAITPLALVFFKRAPAGQVAKISALLLAAVAVFFIARAAVLPIAFAKPPMELLNNPYIKWQDGHWVDFSPGEKYATIIYTLGRYFLLLCAPVTLTHDYYPRHIPILHWNNSLVLGSLCLYLGLIGYSIWSLWKQKRDPLVFGILFYLITLSVVSNLVFPIGTNMAERFLFMPSIGFCFGATMLLLELIRHRPNLGLRQLLPVLGIFLPITALFSAKTVTRNRAWYDNHSLAFTDISTSFKSAKLQSFCGLMMLLDAQEQKDPIEKEAKLRQSIEQNTKAIEIHPTYKTALLNRGAGYYYLKQYDDAIRDLREVIRLAPQDEKGMRMLSLALCGKGKYLEEEKKDPVTALAYLAEAVEVDGNDQEALWRLGVVQVNLGNYPQGIRCLSRFAEMRPDDAAAWESLGWAYGLSGEHAKEAECRAKAGRLKVR